MKKEKEAMLASLRAKTGDTIQRRQVGLLTGGLISPKTLANHDTAGTGVDGAFRVRGKVCYPTKSLVDWLFDDSGSQAMV